MSAEKTLIVYLFSLVVYMPRVDAGVEPIYGHDISDGPSVICIVYLCLEAFMLIYATRTQ